MLKISDSCYHALARLVVYHATRGQMASTSEMTRIGHKGGLYRLTLSACALRPYGKQIRVKSAELRAVNTNSEPVETNFDAEILNDYVKFHCL